MWSVFRKLLKALFFCPVTKMLKAPSLEGAFLVSATPRIGKPPGMRYWNGGCVLAESLGKSYPWAVFFFGNAELSLELWTVISGISGFDD